MEPTPVESKVVPEPAPAVEVALPTYRTKVGEVTRRETLATTVAAPVPEPAASVVPAEKPAEEPKAEEPAPAQEQTVNSVLGDLIVFRLLSLRRKRRRKRRSIWRKRKRRKRKWWTTRNGFRMRNLMLDLIEWTDSHRRESVAEDLI